MTNSNDRKPDDVVDQAFAALRAKQVASGPPSLVVSETIEKLQSLNEPMRIALPMERRRRMLYMFRYTASAAAVLLAVLGSFWLLVDRNASVSFAQVVENVKNAKSVSFVLKQKLGEQPEIDSKLYLQGEFLRYELPEKFVFIQDSKKREIFGLDPFRKVATRSKLDPKMPPQAFADPIERLRNLKEHIKDHVEQLPDETVNGRKCQVYKIKGRINNSTSLLLPDQFTLWADAKTGLPVKIVAKDEHTFLQYEQFQWDEPLNPELFSMQVPKGYLLEEPGTPIIKPGRIYYHQEGGVGLHCIRPDGQESAVQFAPRFPGNKETYVADKAELSPDGRYLAMAYTHSTKEGRFPPYRVLLWDRLAPSVEPTETYARPDGELQSWQFSADGQKLYVNWWEGVPTQRGPNGRVGTDVVDLNIGTKETLKLPTYKDAQGKEQEMRFGAVSPDGQTYLVVGLGLHVASADGKLLRRLSSNGMPVFPASVRLSPDGKQAVFVTFHAADKSQQLFVVNVAGGEPKELVPAGKYTQLRARWSPDGKRIAYTSRLLDPKHPPFNYGKQSYLKLIDPDGSNEVTVLTHETHPNGTGLELTAWR